MEKKYIVTVTSPKEEGFEVGVSHSSDEINIAIKLNQSVPCKESDLRVNITPCDAKVADLPEKLINGTASKAFFKKFDIQKIFKKFGVQKEGCYGATPDSRGKWFIPADTFEGFYDLNRVFAGLSELTSMDLRSLRTDNVSKIPQFGIRNSA